ncbi:CHAT domain-containing protein [Kribbella sp. NPDC050124]|uniref:CHAT domain-containing protein n=1 Tax=Kribbella sp. NPDC050124 TaxID=3364114 RepID=UPI0037AB72B6
MQKSRLYFRIHTPDEPGKLHLRLCLYHHNALLRVHHLTLHIGRKAARYVVRTPYAIAGSPTTAEVGRLAQRRLSVYTNTTGDGTHDFFFRVADGDATTALSGGFDGLEVQSLLRMVRGGLRTVAWGSNSPADESAYKYPQRPDGMFGSTFSRLRDDLIDLARNGYDAWEQITSRLGGPQQRRSLQQLMRRPGGIVDIAPRTDATFMPPMAGLYDLDLDTEADAPLSFCPAAEEALRGHTPLLDTTCFGSEGCRHADEETVCPSGFWGLRHDIGVPLSGGLDDGAAPRLSIGVGAPQSALVGTVPEQVVAGVTTHASEVIQRLPGSIHVTDRTTWFTEAARQATYPILYFLCHGEERARGPVLVLGRAGISRSNLTAKKVSLDHQPLVVMNACDTAALEPEKAISLVQGFVYHGAGAVVGTEITIFTSLAYGFALAFLDSLLTDHASLGTALRASRLELLRRGNPLGLAYILYGLPDARLTTNGADLGER